VSYVRIEYAGIAYQPNSETNGLTCGGVGLGTTLDHIQVSFGGDDAFEFFGGTVNAKYLISYRGVDDEFDTDYGYSGRIQFALSLRDSSFADVSGSNGFESDNDATGTTNAPLTKAIITNMTIVGPKRTLSTTVHTNYRRAAHLRRSTSQCTYNSILMGYPVGLKIENTTTSANANSNTLQWKNNILAGCPQALDSAGLTGFGMLNWYNANSNTTLTNVSDLMLVNPYNFTNPNFQPNAGSPALTGASFTSPNLNNAFFTTTTYRGAFDGTNDWTRCWANWNPQATPYTSAGINNLPLTVSVSDTTTFCAGDSVVLTANSSATSWAWSGGGSAASLTVTSTGSYVVTVSNAAGCTTVSDAISVTVNPSPTANVSPGGSTTFCQGGSVILTSSASTSYLWNNNSTSQSLLVTSSGNYVVTVTDANGCTNSSSPVSVTVNPLPTATANANGNTSFCTGDSLEICANSGSSYLWSNGANTQCTYVNATGNYSVQVTDGNNCTSTPSNSINVNVSATPPPSVNVQGDTVLCQGETVTICSSPADTYAWSNGDTSQCITVSAAAVYNVTVTNANQCDGVGASDDVTITVNSAPVASFTTSGSFPTLTFTNTSTNSTSWAWDFGDGNSSSQENPVHFYQTEGVYEVCLTSTNAAGCEATVCDSVDVLTSINQAMETASVNVFPNPAENEITFALTLNSRTNVSLTLVSLTGSVVYQSQNELSAGVNEVKVDVTALPAGMYLARINAGTSVKNIRVAIVK
jgi:PKD repeat protein